MKKILKSRLFSFILGLIVATSISVYATITYQASQIKYTKSNNTEVTLDTALNELYTEVDKDILTRLNLSSSKVSYNENYGHRIPNMSTTLDLQAGTYLIIGAYSNSGGSTGTSNVITHGSAISLNDNNECARLLGRRVENYIKPYSSANSNQSLQQWHALTTFICKFNTSKILTVSSNVTSSENNYHESNIMAQAIKLD